MPLDTGERAPF